MRFQLYMSTDNAAFGDEPQFEVARILRSIADRIEREGFSGFWETIHDANGNDVGRFTLKPEEELAH